MRMSIVRLSLVSWYRVKGALWGPMVFLSMMFLIEGSLWWSISQRTGSVGSYSFRNILLYSLAALSISQIVSCIGEPDSISEKIEFGDLDKYLVRPVEIIQYMSLIQLGICFARTLVLVPIVMLSQWLVFGHLLWVSCLKLLVLLPLAAIINYMMNHLISTLTFYYRESYAFVSIKESLFWIASGALIPLDFFPHFSWVRYFPPAYVTYFPVQVFLGRTDLTGVLLGQMCLCVILFVALHYSWAKGVRHYQAFGG